MPKPLFTIVVEVSAMPRAIYFATRRPKGFDKVLFEDVTKRVVRLAIEADEHDSNGMHMLRRIDSAGQTVWVTKHPSLQETFWHAEWEYEVLQDKWEKVK